MAKSHKRFQNTVNLSFEKEPLQEGRFIVGRAKKNIGSSVLFHIVVEIGVAFITRISHCK